MPGKAMRMMTDNRIRTDIYKEAIRIAHPQRWILKCFMPTMNHDENIVSIVTRLNNFIIIFNRVQWSSSRIIAMSRSKFILRNCYEC